MAAAAPMAKPLDLSTVSTGLSTGSGLGRKPRIGVIVFPGSNCDRDAGNAFMETAQGETVYVHCKAGRARSGTCFGPPRRPRTLATNDRLGRAEARRHRASPSRGTCA